MTEKQQAQEVVIDGVRYLPVTNDGAQVLKHLENLYRLIWVEACYDPSNDATKDFANHLLPDIRAINEIMKFKK